MVARFAVFSSIVVVIFAPLSNAECSKLITETCSQHSLGITESCAEVGQCVGEYPELPTCSWIYNETRAAKDSEDASPQINLTDPVIGSESGNDNYEYTGSQVVCGETRDCHPDCDLQIDDCKALTSASWLPHIIYTNPVPVGNSCQPE